MSLGSVLRLDPRVGWRCKKETHWDTVMVMRGKDGYGGVAET